MNIDEQYRVESQDGADFWRRNRITLGRTAGARCFIYNEPCKDGRNTTFYGLTEDEAQTVWDRLHEYKAMDNEMFVHVCMEAVYGAK